MTNRIQFYSTLSCKKCSIDVDVVFSEGEEKMPDGGSREPRIEDADNGFTVDAKGDSVICNKCGEVIYSLNSIDKREYFEGRRMGVSKPMNVDEYFEK